MNSHTRLTLNDPSKFILEKIPVSPTVFRISLFYVLDHKVYLTKLIQNSTRQAWNFVAQNLPYMYFSVFINVKTEKQKALIDLVEEIPTGCVEGLPYILELFNQIDWTQALLENLHSKMYHPRMVVGKKKENKLQSQLISKALVNHSLASKFDIQLVSLTHLDLTNSFNGKNVQMFLKNYLVDLNSILVPALFPGIKELDLSNSNMNAVLGKTELSEEENQKLEFLVFVKKYIRSHLPSLLEPLSNRAENGSNFELTLPVKTYYERLIQPMFDGELILFYPFVIKTLLDRIEIDKGRSFLEHLKNEEKFYKLTDLYSSIDQFKQTMKFVILSYIIDKLRKVDSGRVYQLEFCQRFKTFLQDFIIKILQEIDKLEYKDKDLLYLTVKLFFSKLKMLFINVRPSILLLASRIELFLDHYFSNFENNDVWKNSKLFTAQRSHIDSVFLLINLLGYETPMSSSLVYSRLKMFKLDTETGQDSRIII